MNKLPITVVIPVKNEEKNLHECLQGLSSFQEVLVIDSGSSDRSREIANEHGAKVVEFKWNGEFPKKRNWILRNHPLQTPWIFFLDADERVTPKFIQELQYAILKSNISGYWLSYKDHFQKKCVRRGIPFRKLALFRVGSGEYEQSANSQNVSHFDMEIHEHPILNGITDKIKSPLLHLNYKNLEHYLLKHNEYAKWETERFFYFQSNPKKIKELTSRQQTKYKNLNKTWFPFAYFIMHYFIKLGFLDGRAGLDFAIMKFHYFYQIKCRIQEHRDSVPKI